MIDKLLKNPKYDPFFHFLEKKLISLLIIILASFLLLSKLLLILKVQLLVPYLQRVDNFFSNNLVNILIDRDSTLITLSAIFIGIYFTTFTLMATISSNSTFSILKKQQFSDLIRYIKNAFFASFLYLVISLLLPSIKSLGWVFSSVSLLLLTYMLLSAFRFGGLIYMILIKDIDRFISNVDAENDKLIKQERIFNDLEEFLLDQKKNRQIENADKISQFLEKRKNQ